MENMIKVVMVEPIKEPNPAEVENTLEGLQKAVGALTKMFKAKPNGEETS